jgi:dUTP pyrophosphatase
VAFKKGLVLPNAPGTIDADYPDEWLVMLRNDTATAVTIEHGERIAQVVLNRFAVLPWSAGTVGVSSDRTGGVGSTGAS